MKIKEKIFMVVVLIFLVSCGEVPENSNNNGGGSYGLGLYSAPILMGDIVEKPATGIYVTGNDITSSTLPYVELSPSKITTIVYGNLSPVAVKQASIFEVVSALSDNLEVTTSCHTGLPMNNCMSSFIYKPKCSGQVSSNVKLQADKGGATVINVIGKTEDNGVQCEKNVDDNVTMTISDSSHYFKNINEIFYFTVNVDKPAKNGYRYSANGAANGFYYSYECYHSDNKTCNGFVQLLGKVGRYDCRDSETELALKIKADYFEGTKSVTFTAKGFGLGKDDNYTCMMK